MYKRRRKKKRKLQIYKVLPGAYFSASRTPISQKAERFRVSNDNFYSDSIERNSQKMSAILSWSPSVTLTSATLCPISKVLHTSQQVIVEGGGIPTLES